MSSSWGIGSSRTDSHVSTGPSSPFRDILEPLSKQLTGLSEAEADELRSLGEEGDADIFWTDLIRLGSKLEARDKLGAALPIFGLAAASAPEEFQRKAQIRLDAIEGRGAIGGRVEFHLRRFARDAFSPEMILPMMAGSAVYGLSKGLALGRFAGATNPLWWMRGAAGRFSAASLGYVAEVPAFVIASRAMRIHSPSGNDVGFGQELAGAALTLGLLKTTGALAQSGLQRYWGPQASPGLRFAAEQASMFVGLASAHALEEGFGVRPHSEGATALTDILSSMVSLGIGSKLGQRLLGSGHELRSREFQTRIQKGGAELNFSKIFPPRELAAISGPQQMWMSGDSKDDGGPANPKERPIRKWPAPKKARPVHRFEHSGTSFEMTGQKAELKELEGLREDFLDLLVSGQEEAMALEGPIVERLRRDPSLRARILRVSQLVVVECDAARRKILGLRVESEGKPIFYVEGSGEPREPIVDPKPRPKGRRKPVQKPETIDLSADPEKSQEAFEFRSKAFSKATGSSFLDADIAFAQDLLTSLTEGKGYIPSPNYRWEVLEAFEARLMQAEGPKYEALRNEVWRKYKVASESEAVFLAVQPIVRDGLDQLPATVDMSEWPEPWHGVRDEVSQIVSTIKRHRFWTGENKSVQILRINELLNDFGPANRKPEEALAALAQFKRYRNQEIGYVSLRRNLLELMRHGEIRSKPAPLPSTQALPTPPEVVSSQTVSLKTFQFYAERNPAWKEVGQRLGSLYERLAPAENGEIWLERLADLCDRGLELAETDASFTPPKALRWLEAFEASRRGEKTWEEFEAINPLTVKPQPRYETPPPRSQPEIPPKPASEAPPSPVEAVEVSPSPPLQPRGAGDFRLASALRLFTIPQAAPDGAKEFEVRLFLPNLKQLRWRMNVNSQGEMSLRAGSANDFEVEKVEGFNGRFRLRQASSEFLIDLQSVQDRSGNVQRLELAPVQPESGEGAEKLFSSRPPSLGPVQVEHADMVAFNSVKGEGGFQFRYHLHLSNGDRVSLIGHTSHRQGGQVEIHEARIQRFGEDEPASQPMEISVSRVKARHHRVLLSDATGYRLDLEFKSPIGAEKWRPSWTRLDVTKAPEPIHLRWKMMPEAHAEKFVDTDGSIRELSADVLSGKIEAVDKLGANGREHDLAIWELRELFEMTWQAEAKDADFGGIDLIRLREKIGAALREAGRENPFAKKILGQLEQVYGMASLIEAPAPIKIPSSLPPAEPAPPPPRAVRAPAKPSPPVESAPQVKAPKPVKAKMTAAEKIEQTIQRGLRGHLKRVLSHEVTGELIKDLEALNPEELQALAERTAEQHGKATNDGDLREIFLYYTLGVLITRRRGMSYVEAIADGLRVGASPASPRQLTEYVLGLCRRLMYQPGTQDLFKAQSSDTAGIAELRRRLKASSKIGPEKFNEGRQAQAENFNLAQSLGSHESQKMREELISSLHFLYRQTMVAKHWGMNALVKEYQTEIALGFVAFLGVTVNRVDSHYTNLAMRRLGVSITDEEPGVFYFHPFPGEFSTTIKIQLPPLDLGAAKHIFKPSKK